MLSLMFGVFDCFQIFYKHDCCRSHRVPYNFQIYLLDKYLASITVCVNFFPKSEISTSSEAYKILLNRNARENVRERRLYMPSMCPKIRFRLGVCSSNNCNLTTLFLPTSRRLTSAWSPPFNCCYTILFVMYRFGKAIRIILHLQFWLLMFVVQPVGYVSYLSFILPFVSTILHYMMWTSMYIIC